MKKKYIITFVCFIIVSAFLLAFFLRNGATRTTLNSNSTNTQAVNVALPSTTNASLRSGIDLYTNTDLGFSIEMPSSWRARTYADSVQDVQYGGYSVTFESSPKPLYYSDGVAPKNESEVSLEGSALFVGQNSYNADTLTSYLDTTYQKGMYTTRTSAIGNGISATRIETTGYTTQYNPHYVVVSGNLIYTLSVRANTPFDDEAITTMLKSFKLL